MKPKNHGKRWSDEDDNYLQERWGRTTIEKLAEKLERTEESIRQRSITLNLGRWQEAGGIYIGPTQISELIGMSLKGVYYWIETNKLPARSVKKNKNHIHQVDMLDLIKFLEENQDLWDSRNLERFGLGQEFKWLKEKRKRDLKKHTKHREPWTKADDERLLELYKQGLTPDEIAEELKRTSTSIVVRLSKRRRKGERIPVKKIQVPWTEEETEMMLDLEKQGYTDDEIAYELGRERNHISYRRFRLRKNGEYEGFKYENV